jgi:hypothetical protein
VSLRNFMIITATIRPPEGAFALVRTDPEARMRDYLGAFAFYLDRLKVGTLDQLIFVDNSNSQDHAARIGDLAHERGLSDRVEVISYDGLDYPPAYGRSYGEFKLMEDAYGLSKVLKARAPDDIVWKVTGRYTIRNLDAIVRKRPLDADLYCNSRTFPRQYTDTYLLAWTERGFQDFLRGINEKVRIDDHKAPAGETIVWDLVAAEIAKKRLKIVQRFNVTPFIEGVRGYNNREYHSLNEMWKYSLRVALLHLAPWLWV